MSNYICKTCGTQFPESDSVPSQCPICHDDRQYLGLEGQQWTTMEELCVDHRNRIEEVEPGLTGIGTEPSFAIGQRALLVQTPEGNLLWDCISLLDEETKAAVEKLGGVRAIAISHPHFYSCNVEWAKAFGAQVWLHEADEAHVMRPDSVQQYWGGESFELFGGLTLIRTGGHFEGSSVAHWPAAADGKGAILTGDSIMVVPDRRWVSFMFSYPNLIPLPPRKVREIVRAVEPYEFDRVYSGWWDRVLKTDGKNAVRRSAERYIDRMS